MFSARLGHGTGLLTRVIRRYQPSQMDERRRDLAADPWGEITVKLLLVYS
jgi:hypothetical protein